MCVLIRFNNVISPSLFFFLLFFLISYFFFFFSLVTSSVHMFDRLKKRATFRNFQRRGVILSLLPLFFRRRDGNDCCFLFFFFPFFCFFSFKYIDYRESLRVTCVCNVLLFFLFSPVWPVCIRYVYTYIVFFLQGTGSLHTHTYMFTFAERPSFSRTRWHSL